MQIYIPTPMYLFRTTINGMKKKGLKISTSTTIEQSISSNEPLTLFRRMRIHKAVIFVITCFKESSVDKEPLIKRMMKPAPTIEVEVVGETTIRET